MERPLRGTQQVPAKTVLTLQHVELQAHTWFLKEIGLEFAMTYSARLLLYLQHVYISHYCSFVDNPELSR